MAPTPSPHDPNSPSRQTRQLALAARLRPDRWKRAEDLARTFGVSVRTIYRDMEALTEAGVPLVAVPGKGYRLEAAESTAPSLGGFGMRVASASDEATHPTLQQAMARQRAVQFTLQPEGASRTVDPYGLLRRGERELLVGYDHDRERVNHVPLHRITDLAVRDDLPFERPSGYAAPPDEVPRDLTVRVRFVPAVAEEVRVAPPLFMERMESDGEALVLTLKVQREADVLSWLLGWGDRVRVLEPASLRRRLADEARRVAAQYEEEPELLL